MTYKETIDTLYNMLPDFQKTGADAYKPGLERVTEFNTLLGNPDRSFASVHVAGTNGKGSVSHLLASALQAAGYRTGLYTSPHLRDFRERIRVDGETIEEEQVVGFAARHMEYMSSSGMSFFEATMCMAFDHFARQGVDMAVVETGLGGRLDSTNIITPVLSIITNIGMDHTALLGDTVEKIAAEKAGIIKPGVPVVVGERDPASEGVFARVAAEKDSEIIFAGSRFRCTGRRGGPCVQLLDMERLADGSVLTLQTDLMGAYQCRNAVTALAAIGVLDARGRFPVGAPAVSEGFATAALATGLGGRWEIMGRRPLVVADTGHNAHALRLVAEQLRDEMRDGGHEKLYMVTGFVDDKDIGAILPLLPRNAFYFFTSPPGRRALPAAELARLARAVGLDGIVVDDPRDALAAARARATTRDMIFVGGSTYVVAEVYKETY